MSNRLKGPEGEVSRVITRLRITERGASGVHVSFQTSDGMRRSAWVPAGVVEEARSRMLANHDRVAPTDGGPLLGREAGDLIAILCAQAGETWSDALYETSWIGSLEAEQLKAAMLEQEPASLHGQPPIEEYVSESRRRMVLPATYQPPHAGDLHRPRDLDAWAMGCLAIGVGIAMLATLAAVATL